MIAATLLACAANIAPVTLEAVIRVESGGNVLAVNVNHLAGPQPHPASLAEAVQVAESYIRRGYSVDLGLMQVNSRNLPALGDTVAQVLDPCTNIRAGGAILTADYADAARSRGEGQGALQAALSAYNTGTFWRGFANGYVAKYYGRKAVPALADGVRDAAARVTAIRQGRTGSAPAPAANPYTSETTVYAREASSFHVE